VREGRKPGFGGFDREVGAVWVEEGRSVVEASRAKMQEVV
jgi:hypothetical protein